jgi:hypothetical protein
MTLHCASRLGFIDYIYNERNIISAAIGLIDEVPIAVCGSGYEQPKRFKINHQKEHQSFPPAPTKAQAINLFFVPTCVAQNVPFTSMDDVGHHD